MYSLYQMFIRVMYRESQFYATPYSYKVPFRDVWHRYNEYETKTFVIISLPNL